MDLIPLANILVQLGVRLADVQRQFFPLRFVIVHPLLGFLQLFEKSLRGRTFVSGCFFVFVLIAVVDSLRETVIFIGRIVLRIQIAQLFLDFVDLRFVLLLLGSSLLELLLQLLKFSAIQRR